MPLVKLIKEVLAVSIILAPTAAVLSYMQVSVDNLTPTKDRASNVEVLALDQTTKFKSVGLVSLAPTSSDCLAENMYFEARNQGNNGMIAVVDVVKTRAKYDLDNKACSVIRKPNQFSWYGVEEEIVDDKSFAKAKYLASLAMEGTLKSVMPKADHYFADYIDEPAWAKNMYYLGKVGAHHFFDSTRPRQKVKGKPVQLVKNVTPTKV